MLRYVDARYPGAALDAIAYVTVAGSAVTADKELTLTLTLTLTLILTLTLTRTLTLTLTLVNEHAEARRAKAAAAAALLKSPGGNGVVATARAEMSALSPPSPDRTAEQGAQGWG